jgi:hypothetical protein
MNKRSHKSQNVCESVTLRVRAALDPVCSLHHFQSGMHFVYCAYLMYLSDHENNYFGQLSFLFGMKVRTFANSLADT